HVGGHRQPGPRAHRLGRYAPARGVGARGGRLLRAGAAAERATAAAPAAPAASAAAAAPTSGTPEALPRSAGDRAPGWNGADEDSPRRLLGRRHTANARQAVRPRARTEAEGRSPQARGFPGLPRGRP